MVDIIYYALQLVVAHALMARRKGCIRRQPKLPLLKIKIKEPLSVRSFAVSLSERK